MGAVGIEMKKLIIVGLLRLGGFFLWKTWMTRSETVALDGSGYELTAAPVRVHRRKAARNEYGTAGGLQILR